MRNLWRFNSKLAWCVVALIFGIVGPARAQVGPQSVFLEVRTPQFDLTVNSTGAPSSGTCSVSVGKSLNRRPCAFVTSWRP